MNDFTKDELSYLLHALKNLHANYMPELEIKIKSLINNYCEHESSGPGWCPGLYDKIVSDKEIMAKDLVRIYECNKCGEFFR